MEVAVYIHRRTADPKVHNDPLNFWRVMQCNRNSVVPTTTCPGEPAPIMWPVYAKKKVSIAVLPNMPFLNHLKYHLMRALKLFFCNVCSLFKNWHNFSFAISIWGSWKCAYWGECLPHLFSYLSSCLRWPAVLNCIDSGRFYFARLPQGFTPCCIPALPMRC